MRIKEGFVLRQVAGQGMVIATGEASKNFHGMVKLNDTGSLIWQGVANGLTLEMIADQLTDKYEVDHQKALTDVEAMVDQMKKAGFVIE